MRAAGWDAALSLCDDEFIGWEVGFLGHAIGVLGEDERSFDFRAQENAIRRAFGSS